MKRVTEIFKAWDMNGDGRISCKEFSRALTALGVRATPEDIDAFFKSLDRDHSGSIEFAELRALLHSLQRLERARPSHANLTDSDKLGQLAAAAGSGGHLSRWAQPAAKILLGTLLTDEIKPIDELRCEILGKGTAVIELFRSWDLDKDGKVSRREFREAVAMMKCSFDTAVVDGLFEMLDQDHSGKIDYAELDGVLRRSARRVEKAITPSLCRQLLPRSAVIFLFGPPCKEKEILCRKLAFMFRGTWLTAEEIVEGELETPASSMSQEIRKLQDAGQPFPPRLMKGLLRAAFSRKEGPFFLYDLPSSLEEMHLFEREFGWAKVALEVVLPEWKGGLQTEALSKEYSDRGLLLQMLAKLSSDTLVHQVITQLQVRSYRERIERQEARQRQVQADAEVARQQRLYLDACTARLVERFEIERGRNAREVDYMTCKQKVFVQRASSADGRRRSQTEANSVALRMQDPSLSPRFLSYLARRITSPHSQQMGWKSQRLSMVPMRAETPQPHSARLKATYSARLEVPAYMPCTKSRTGISPRSGKPCLQGVLPLP